MKKILFILIVIVFLFSCENKGCSNEIVEFTHNGVLTYYLDENPKDALKKIKLKILSNKKENLLSLDHQDIKVEKFSFDKIGDFTAIVRYKNKNYSLKYKVEIRKWDGKTDVSWFDNSIDSYEISTAKELAGLAELVNQGNDFNGKLIKLKYDIDLNNHPWIPIGTNGVGVFNEVNKYFSGTFDGGNHTIYNLYTKSNHQSMGEHLDPNTSYYHFGLFGYIKNNTIKNLTIQGVNIINGMGNNYTRSFQGTGALVGYTSGNVIIENVKIMGDIKIKGEYKVGGIVGSSSGESIKLVNSYIRGKENSIICGTDEEYKDTNNFGGLIGFTATSKTSLENVVSNIDVDGYTSGGLIGNATEGTLEIVNASVYGNISNKEGSVVGGFIGGRFVTMNLTNCYMVGKVSSKESNYADICVSLYGDKSESIKITDVYFNSDNYDSEKVNNSLNITGKTKEELDSLIKDELK